MNARKMKRRAYRHQGQVIAMRKRVRGYMAQHIKKHFERMALAMVKKVIQPFLDMVEAANRAGNSMSMLTGAIGGTTSPGWSYPKAPL